MYWRGWWVSLMRALILYLLFISSVKLTQHLQAFSSIQGWGAFHLRKRCQRLRTFGNNFEWCARPPLANNIATTRYWLVVLKWRTTTQKQTILFSFYKHNHRVFSVLDIAVRWSWNDNLYLVDIMVYEIYQQYIINQPTDRNLYTRTVSPSPLQSATIDITCRVRNQSLWYTMCICICIVELAKKCLKTHHTSFAHCVDGMA